MNTILPSPCAWVLAALVSAHLSCSSKKTDVANEPTVSSNQVVTVEAAIAGDWDTNAFLVFTNLLNYDVPHEVAFGSPIPDVGPWLICTSSNGPAYFHPTNTWLRTKYQPVIQGRTNNWWTIRFEEAAP